MVLRANAGARPGVVSPDTLSSHDSLYPSPRTAATKVHKLWCLKPQKCVLSHQEARHPKSRCWQGHLSGETLSEDPALPRPVAMAVVLWLGPDLGGSFARVSLLGLQTGPQALVRLLRLLHATVTARQGGSSRDGSGFHLSGPGCQGKPGSFLWTNFRNQIILPAAFVVKTGESTPRFKRAIDPISEWETAKEIHGHFSLKRM